MNILYGPYGCRRHRWLTLASWTIADVRAEPRYIFRAVPAYLRNVRKCARIQKDA